MSVSVREVNDVMNTAIGYLVAAGIPVNPQTHHDMCTAWLESLAGTQDPIGRQTRRALHCAVLTLQQKLTYSNA